MTFESDRFLEPHSDHIVDRWKIIEVLNAYAFHFDRNEPRKVGELFTAEALIDYGPEMEPIHGREALVEVVSAGLEEVFAATSHHISNVSVRFVEAGTAQAIAYLHAWHQYIDGSPDGYLWGQYHTRLRLTQDGWRFTHLTLKIAGMIDFHRTEMHPIGRCPPDAGLA